MSSSLAPSLSSPACRPEPERPSAAAAWRDVLLPREHGSWSLAFEPVVLGLIAAPSHGGAWFALAVAAGFFARRPLRLAVRESNPARRNVARAACGACAAVALAAAAATVSVAGTDWLLWVAPTALAGAVFLGFDLRNEGRAEVAEVVGSAAFGFLPAVFAVLAGVPARVAWLLAFVMLARAVPTVLVVRSGVRAAKTGVRKVAGPLVVSVAVFAVSVLLHVTGLAPVTWVVLLGLLALRAVWLLFARPCPRARTIGMIEAILGVVFVIVAGM